jgi:hypothetical protein
MSDDDHAVIKWFNDYAQSEDAARETRNKFIKLSDAERTKELQNLSSWLSDDSSLQSKASLLHLGRELGRLHAALRRVQR